MNYDIINILEFESIKNDILSLDTYFENKTLIVSVTMKPNTVKCEHCISTSLKIKEYKTVNIKHAISHTKDVTIRFRKRRYLCTLCRKTFNEFDPFTDHSFRISKLSIFNILEYLKDPNHTFSSCSKLFNIDVGTIISIFDSYVDPKRRTLPEVLCIDEVHIKSNTKYPYACVLLDFKTNMIVDVLKTRQKKYLKEYFDSFTYQELKQVKYVVMDLWSPYKQIVEEFMPDALIVADAFHVVVNINRILDRKRIQVMKRYLELDIPNLNYTNDFGYLLKRFSWMIRYSPNKINAKTYYIKKYQMYVYKNDLLTHLLSSDPELKEIYELRNVYQTFNRRTKMIEAKDELEKLIEVFIKHKIPEVREYGRLLYRWKKEIINSFNTYDGVRYSNGKLESRNRQIKTILRNGFGYKNFSRFRSRVFYSINKDVPIKLK